MATKPKTEHKIEKKSSKDDGRYIEAIGRRKTSVARVRLTPASKNHFEINGKELAVYFPTKEMVSIAEEALKPAGSFKVTAVIKGGGIHSQAEALRHGIARALSVGEDNIRTTMKVAGFLKRDPRAKERRKFGLKKARKAPQWSKR